MWLSLTQSSHKKLYLTSTAIPADRWKQLGLVHFGLEPRPKLCFSLLELAGALLDRLTDSLNLGQPVRPLQRPLVIVVRFLLDSKGAEPPMLWTRTSRLRPRFG